MNIYEITSEYIGESEPVTLEQAQEIVNGWDEYEGWELTVIEYFDEEIRIEATCTLDDPYDAFTLPGEWVRVTADYYYLVIGEAIQ